jgi:hypothetical protein
MPFGNQASVSGMTRMKAEEGQAIFTRPDFMSRRYASHDLAEDTIFHRTCSGSHAKAI